MTYAQEEYDKSVAEAEQGVLHRGGDYAIALALIAVAKAIVLLSDDISRELHSGMDINVHPETHER
jgi:hypothetical protein